MSSPVDPNDVLMTGENSFIRYSAMAARPRPTARATARAVVPGGRGHACS